MTRAHRVKPSLHPVPVERNGCNTSDPASSSRTLFFFEELGIFFLLSDRDRG